MTLHRLPARECLPAGRALQGASPFGIKPDAAWSRPRKSKSRGQPHAVLRPIYSARRRHRP